MPETTASLLPTIPRIFFLYLEPVAITYGMFMNYAARLPMFSAIPLLSNMDNNNKDQAPLPLPTLISPAMCTGYLLTIMLYGLVILLASPPSKRLLQLHIGVLIAADLWHWMGLFGTIAETDPRGWAGLLDTSAWSPDVWNLALYPIGTLSVKIATLMGWFGEIRG